MRPGQQNNNNNNKNRSRGRSSNNNNNGGRKHVNPLSRNYESNGPDVKVRGNAAHIAEKYVQLARDAQASGDSVMAENYFQHAEHYNRIVMAAQPPGMVRPDQFGQEFDGDEEELDGNTSEENPEFAGQGEQPVVAQQPQQQQPREERSERLPREERQRRREQRAPREDRSAEAPAAVEAVAAEAVAAPAAVSAEPAGEEGGEAAEPKRARRPRRPRRAAGEGVDPADAPQPDVGELPAFITAGTSTAAE